MSRVEGNGSQVNKALERIFFLSKQRQETQGICVLTFQEVDLNTARCACDKAASKKHMRGCKRRRRQKRKQGNKVKGRVTVQEGTFTGRK